MAYQIYNIHLCNGEVIRIMEDYDLPVEEGLIGEFEKAPTDKLMVDGQKNPRAKTGKTNILLIRTGEAKRGVVGLYQAGLKNEESRGLSVRFRGIDDKGVASYLLSLYCSAAILADDAIACLEDVEVGEYYDYD